MRENHQSMRESEENLSTVLNSIGEAVIFTDTGGQVTRMNPAAENLTGWGSSEAIGRPISEVLKTVDALTREPIRIPVDEVPSTGEECHLADHTALISRDGTERQIAGRVVPIRSDSDTITGVVVVFSDMTDRKLAEDTLLANAAFQRALLDAVPAPIFCKDTDGRYVRCNRAFVEFCGLPEEEIIGKTVYDIAPKELAITCSQQDRKLLKSKRMQVYESRMPSADGGMRDVMFHMAIYSDSEGRTLGLMGVILDITQRKQTEEELVKSRTDLQRLNDELESALLYANELAVHAENAKAQTEDKAIELSYQATHDSLTGLPNRQYFEKHLSECISGTADNKPDQLVVLFLDLDKFKLINDTLGHKVGDLLLVEVAARVQSRLRSGDVLARMGGDEFTIILPHCNRRPSAEMVASRIIDSIGQPFEIEGHRFLIGASIGLAHYPSDGNDAVTLLKHSDAAMYKAKQAGRGTYRWYTGDVDKDNQSRIEIEMDIRSALDKGQFLVYYQPIVGLEDGKLYGAEALLRWEHPKKGMISPSLFIPITEEIGLIGSIGDYVLRSACSQAIAWRDEGVRLSQISVNISTVQVRNSSWLDSVKAALSDSGLDPRCLNLELTETDLAADYESLGATLRGVEELGIGVAIDDFGIGQSSLGRLKDFPVNHLKIDGSFVRNIECSENDKALVRSIIEMAQGQGKKVTAEWVETEAQMNILRSSGCDFAQGYFISPPLPADKFLEFAIERAASATCRRQAA